jgi:hypothetical protein
MSRKKDSQDMDGSFGNAFGKSLQKLHRISEKHNQLPTANEKSTAAPSIPLDPIANEQLMPKSPDQTGDRMLLSIRANELMITPSVSEEIIASSPPSNKTNKVPSAKETSLKIKQPTTSSAAKATSRPNSAKPLIKQGIYSSNNKKKKVSSKTNSKKPKVQERNAPPLQTSNELFK